MTKLSRTNEGQKESDELQTVKQQVATGDNMYTPTLKKVLCDPRSVSTGILRTPIEVKSS